MQLPKSDLYGKQEKVPEVPIIRGQSGLTGRPNVRPVPDVLETEPGMPPPPAEGLSIPSPCLRSLQSFRPECQPDCIGLQSDGSCLADIYRTAIEAGVSPILEIDPATGNWIFRGYA